MLKVSNQNQSKLKTVSSIKSITSKSQTPSVLTIPEKSKQNLRLSTISSRKKSERSQKSQKTKKNGHKKQKQHENLRSVNNYLYQQLEKQNEEIKNQIMVNKSDQIKNKENILQLVKTMTLKKLKLAENQKEEHSEKQRKSYRKQEEKCEQLCYKDMEKQLLRLKMKRYQLEKEKKDFVKWEEGKLRQLQGLRKMIREMDTMIDPIFI